MESVSSTLKSHGDRFDGKNGLITNCYFSSAKSEKVIIDTDPGIGMYQLLLSANNLTFVFCLNLFNSRISSFVWLIVLQKVNGRLKLKSSAEMRLSLFLFIL